MTASPRKAIRRMSEKKLAGLRTKPWSTISKRSESPRKRPRKKSERERIYGPPGYVEWIHEQPCIACGVVGFSEVAHIKTGGTGRKSDWTDTVPLCGCRAGVPGCHTLAHLIGREAIERRYCIVLTKSVEEIQSRWSSRIQERGA